MRWQGALLGVFVLGSLALLQCSSESTNEAPGGGAGGADASTGATGGSGGTSASGGSGGAQDAAIDQVPAPTCDDGEQNGNEIAVDCGGGCPCDTGQPCQNDIDCKKATCLAGKCQPPNCTDKIANGLESDVDCGGACPKCEDLKACGQPGDCASGVCTQSICQVATCSDQTKNGTESDLDCGGSCSAKCADGAACGTGSDCTSQTCQANKCVAATCLDTLKNGSETDVDCGGSCGACDAGKTCSGAADCKSSVCTGNVCQAPTCTDGTKNGAETAADCGGGTCPACDDGKACAGNADCKSSVCTGTVCLAPTCTDSTKNGSESDVDCGGATCPGCLNGKACGSGSDCASGGCKTSTCGAWSQSFGGTLGDIGYDIATDSAGNIVIAGSFTGSASFGGTALPGVGTTNPDIFVAKYSPTGAHLWSKSFGGGGADQARGVVVAPNGDVYVTGAAGQIDFGGGTLTPPSANADLFVLKLKGSDGSYIWAKLLGGNGGEEGLAIALDQNGDVVIGGNAVNSASFSFGGATFSGKGLADAFVVKLSGANGAHVWSTAAGSPGNDAVHGLATDPNGNVIVTGRFHGGVVTDVTGTFTFGTTNLQSSGYGDVFMAKLAAASGAEVWAKRAGVAASDDYGFGVAAGPAGESVFVGQRTGPIDFGGGPIQTVQGIDVYAAKLDAAGSHVWSVGFGGTSIDAAHEVAFDGPNLVISGAYLSTNLNFGGSTMPNNAGKYAPFVLKLSGSNGGHLYSAGFVAGGDAAGALAVSPQSKSVVMVGRYATTLDLGPGVMTSLGATDVYLASFGPLP